MEAKGQFDFEANESAELSFKKGDLLKVSDIHTLEPNNDSIYKSVITMIVLYCELDYYASCYSYVLIRV